MAILKSSYQQFLHSTKCGAVGFGIGFAAVQILGTFTGVLHGTYGFNKDLYLTTLLYAFAGGLGGAMLGFARVPRVSVYLFTLAGAGGCGFGFFITAIIFPILIEGNIFWNFTIVYLLKFTIIGSLVGASLGAVEKSCKHVVTLMLAGAIGFGLYYLVGVIGLGAYYFAVGGNRPLGNLISSGVHDSIMFGLWGVIGGLIGGACLGIAHAIHRPDRGVQT